MSDSQQAAVQVERVIGWTLAERKAWRIGKTLAQLSPEEIRDLKHDTPSNRCNIEVTHSDGRKRCYCLGMCNGSATLFDAQHNKHGFLLHECKVIF